MVYRNKYYNSKTYIFIMTTFKDLPNHLQQYILEFNPEHRENLKKVQLYLLVMTTQLD